MDINTQSLKLHKKLQGKIAVASKIQIKNKADLSLVYTPGVAEVSRHLHKNPQDAKQYTIKKNTVAVISDGSAVLGLGNVGPLAALPIMEGKCLLFKQFAGINAFPIVLSTQKPEEIILIVKSIAPAFGGINLEDIAAPKCFIIEETLKKMLDVPVVHDDQWGSAIVATAGVINALKVVRKSIHSARIVISGAGAAGSAITKLLYAKGARNLIVCDSKGIISSSNAHTYFKKQLAQITNLENKTGTLAQALIRSDVFIGVSRPQLVTKEMVTSMNEKAVVIAMANPIPEIMPEEAKYGGAYIIATGRSDYPNQINNALAFPGVFRGALDHNVKTITTSMLLRAAENLAGLVKKPASEYIIPSIFDKRVVRGVAKAIVE
jgi:malate dehydrogenase (oxaloacetate-decarboxylating)